MRIFNLISAVLVSFVFVPLTPAIPVTVHTAEALRAVRLGFPIPFVQQNLMRYSLTLPRRVSAGSPLDNPTEIFWGNFFVSLALCGIAIFVILEVIRLASSPGAGAER